MEPRYAPLGGGGVNVKDLRTISIGCVCAEGREGSSAADGMCSSVGQYDPAGPIGESFGNGVTTPTTSTTAANSRASRSAARPPRAHCSSTRRASPTTEPLGVAETMSASAWIPDASDDDELFEHSLAMLYVTPSSLCCGTHPQ